MKKTKTKRGSSLIEALVLVFVFSVVTMSFYSVFALGTRYANDSKNRTIATAIANQRMEKLRNLAYDEVATIGGIPPGDINPDEQITVSGKTFHILTDVYYFDDADDGTFNGSPVDTVPNDYKIGKVTILWGEENEKQRVQLTSRFVPPGVETSAGGGTFSLNTIDYSGNSVSNVSVHLSNANISPPVNYYTQTDTSGSVLLQGVPADTEQNYQITISKNNYETVATLPVPPTGEFSPEDAHFSILEGTLNEKTMKINLLADMDIHSRDPFGNQIANAEFDLIGGRRLDDGTADPPIYSYNDSKSSNANGNFSEDNINPGEYQVGITSESVTETNYAFWKMNPGKDEENDKFNLLPGSDLNVDMILLDRTLDSVFVMVAESDTSFPVEGAEVKLESIDLGYVATLQTDKYGYAYFPSEQETPLQNGEIYNLSVSAEGYDDVNTTVEVDLYTEKEISLEVE